MTVNKSMFDPETIKSALDLEQTERQLALEYLAEAWNTAEEDGVESRSLAHASLFAALATFVKLHGDESTADMVAGLPDRIRSGEYNLDRILQ